MIVNLVLFALEMVLENNFQPVRSGVEDQAIILVQNSVAAQEAGDRANFFPRLLDRPVDAFFAGDRQFHFLSSLVGLTAFVHI